MVSSALKEGVVQVAEVGDHPLLLAHLEHAEVPLPQSVAARHALAAGVAMKYVIVSLSPHHNV